MRACSACNRSIQVKACIGSSQWWSLEKRQSHLRCRTCPAVRATRGGGGTQVQAERSGWSGPPVLGPSDPCAEHKAHIYIVALWLKVPHEPPCWIEFLPAHHDPLLISHRSGLATRSGQVGGILAVCGTPDTVQEEPLGPRTGGPGVPPTGGQIANVQQLHMALRCLQQVYTGPQHALQGQVVTSSAEERSRSHHRCGPARS